MKNLSKLTKKLLLSALTLGLAVVTLTTTTFAWYTTNTEASATGKGSTSGTTDDFSLMISSNNSTWGQSATIENGVNLIPLQWSAENDRFEKLNGDSSASGFYQFTLYFKTSGAASAKDVYLKNILIYNVERTANNLKKFENLSSKTTGCPTDASYAVDAVKALDLVIGTGTDAKAYDLSGKFASVAEEYKYLADQATFNGGTADAVSYYKDVMGITSDFGSETAEFEASLDYSVSLGQIPVGDVLSVTFTVYLNGWDAYCFDACRGQSFNIALDFTTVQPSA